MVAGLDDDFGGVGVQLGEVGGSLVAGVGCAGGALDEALFFGGEVVLGP
ncbi:MAG: hypothetical protein H6716_24670 [Polyangiaceae bacterium]|nr:hypothetical protein [Polyangiaceae bacterium]